MISSAHILGQDQSLLVECQHGFQLLPQVCVAFKRMQHAAHSDGVDLQIVSSYRGFSRQLQIWQKKWSGLTSILDINEQVLDTSSLSDREKLHAIMTWSALPGGSRHHWGTDLDVYDQKRVEQSGNKFELVCSEYEHTGPCAALADWLNQHAITYGFIRPYSRYSGGIATEPWHLSYQPIAEQIISQLNQELLMDNLKASGILGLESISENISEIYQRFVLNKGC
jgi:LAS superfamily LD-carboxypeptidase LdcB